MTRRAPRAGRTYLITAALALLVLLISTAPNPARAAGGTPEVADVACVSDCPGKREASVGSEIRLDGTHLSEVRRVSFAGKGERVETRVTDSGARKLVATVPDGARSGRVGAVLRGGGLSRSKSDLEIVEGADPDPEDDPEPDPDPPSSGSFEVTSVEATPRESFYGAGEGVRVRYRFEAPGPTDVRIEVERKGGPVVASWVVRDADPGTENVERWNGKSSEGRTLDKGKFRFRVSEAGASKRAADSEPSGGFEVLPDLFPVRGKHGYGDGFGAGRGHQGADVFADCGTKLVAARAGKVQYRGYQSSAGNYIVIDTKGSGIDHVYMHLKRPAKVGEGKRVTTGQKIGVVGETGNAQGCHLHFEIWSAPGWYEGGSAQSSVKRDLKRWDGWS